ncbi:MAG: hypothetical protein ACFFD2_20805 [Promethearchaeota archaeon]
MPTCVKCGIQTSNKISEKYNGLYSICYNKLMTHEAVEKSPPNRAFDKEKLYKNITGKLIYCKRCKKDVIPEKEPYSLKHIIGWLTDDRTWMRGWRCPFCKKKLYTITQKVELIIGTIVLIIVCIIIVFSFINFL